MEVNSRNSFQYYAMLFGTYLGIYWILKFPLFPLGLRYPIFMLVFIALTLAVPFVAYYYARIFREKVCGGDIRFINAWLFLLLVYLFASILTAVAHYVYFRYVDNGFILNTYSSLINNIKDNPIFPKGYLDQAKLMIEQTRSLTPIKITLQLISQNIFYGNLLALITAFFVMKRQK
jgi:phosphoglycerol transferase MdoB-like AlkP superfamily enzyme